MVINGGEPELDAPDSSERGRNRAGRGARGERAMRMMMKARMDTQMSNQVTKGGAMPNSLKSVMERLKPEAAYFTPEGGRSVILVFDMQDSSQLPSIADPFFQEMGAEVTFEPVMNLDDLQRGLAALK
ncbi:hypothetical protein ACF05T_05895 [Streptomyces lateritius]|uniref:Uncharacterized protein n=1 Tax=Streptomyces lateritius TaxID=67313 RepID=A0ABW6Y752_9ACTN